MNSPQKKMNAANFTILFPLFCISSVCCDIVKLKTGAEIKGKIESYSEFLGLEVNTEYGKITIKPNNFNAFIITSDGDSLKSIETRYEDSRLKKSGLKLDMKYFSGYDYKYDSDFAGFGKVFFQATNRNSAASFGIVGEELGMSNKEYSDLCINLIKSTSVGFLGSKDSTFQVNGISMLVKEILVEVKGVSVKYYIATFVNKETNFKIFCSTYESVYNKRKEELMSLVKSVSITKE